MLRTALLRSATSARTAIRPVSRSFTRRLATPSRVAAAVPRTLGWVGVRNYSAGGGGLKKEEVEGRIFALLQGFDKVNDPSNVKSTAHFANDLGLDSLDTVEVVMAIEEEFSIEIPDKDADTIHSIDKAVDYIINQPDAH